MTKEEHIQYWIKTAERDLESAQANFDAKRYEWCLFIGHLMLEKTVKSIVCSR